MVARYMEGAQISGRSKGVLGMCTPWVQIISISWFLGNFWQDCMLVPPPQGNPGSATADGYRMVARCAEGHMEWFARCTEGMQRAHGGV